jgi:hypothetical protein
VPGAQSPARSGLKSARLTTALTFAAKVGSGTVHRVIVEAALTGSVTFQDFLGPRLIMAVGFPPGAHEINIAFVGVIEVVTASADRLVVVYE